MVWIIKLSVLPRYNLMIWLAGQGVMSMPWIKRYNKEMDWENRAGQNGDSLF